MAKKKTKKRIAYIFLVISTFILIFNNIGQFLTFVSIPFTKTTQIWIGIFGISLSVIWYMYLDGVIK